MLLVLSTAHAQEHPGQEYLRYLTYSPRYFGPNAFPIPDLRGGRLYNRFELEFRGDYHYFKGDQTHNIFGRLFIPAAEGQAGIEASFIFYEYYNMTQETVEERHAAGQSWKDGARGDLVITAFFQLFKNNKIADLVFEASFKTASGTRLSDARYTDAAAYWMDLNAGFNLFKSADSKSFIRFQGLAGFYCWMTNSIVHRQNDAYLFAAGLNGTLKKLSIQGDIAGFRGYRDNGDRPTILRTKLNYEFKNNILSVRYKHGFHDYLYDTYSLAYIRLF